MFLLYIYIYRNRRDSKSSNKSLPDNKSTKVVVKQRKKKTKDFKLASQTTKRQCTIT